ncbi:MAG TPA: PIN domain-containing protein [Thermodesulfobacteriota bacterium]
MAEKIGIDTSILIYLLEKNPQHVEAARAFMQQVQSGKYDAVFSAIGMIEILTGPKKKEDYELAARYREILTRFPHFVVQDLNENIVEVASDLRATYAIATPDAIHIATAIDFGAKKFFTNDRGLQKIKEITVEIL